MDDYETMVDQLNIISDQRETITSQAKKIEELDSEASFLRRNVEQEIEAHVFAQNRLTAYKALMEKVKESLEVAGELTWDKPSSTNVYEANEVIAEAIKNIEDFEKEKK